MKKKSISIIIALLISVVLGAIFISSTIKQENAGPTEQIDGVVSTKKNEAITSVFNKEDDVIKSEIIEEDGKIIGTLIMNDDVNQERFKQLKKLYDQEIKKQYKDVPREVVVKRESDNLSNHESDNIENDRENRDNPDNQGGEGSMKLTDLPEAALKVQVTPLNMTQVVLVVKELPEDLASAKTIKLYYGGKTFELQKTKTGRNLYHTFEEDLDMEDIKEHATIGL